MLIDNGELVTTMEAHMNSSAGTSRRVWKARALAALAATLGCLALSPAAAVAGPPPGSEFGISSFFTEVKDSGGADETRAGAHPYSVRAAFELNKYDADSNPLVRPIEDPKTIVAKLPAGFSGNPRSVPQCPLTLVPRGSFNPMACPDETIVGYVYLDGAIPLSTPVVNVIPEHGYPAEFAFSEAGMTYPVYPELRSDGDYGINMVAPYANNDSIVGVDFTFCSWGVESTMRANAGESTFRCREQGEPLASGKPFLTNPATECTDVAPVTRLEMDSYANPGVFKFAEFASPLITDCESLDFDPSVDVAPTTSAPDAPSGLNVDMRFPQEDNAAGQAPPALKKAVVTLPDGLTINPSAANGLQACSDGELLLRSKDPMTCPEASRIGTVTATSPLLEEAVEGGVYIRSQNSSDPESGEMFRLALVLRNEARGIDIRLPGQIKVNPTTGRIETIVDNNPELPVSSIDLKLKDGPRAPLATPPTCGPKTIDAQLTSWGGQTVDRQSTFTIDCAPGLGSFLPSFDAGTSGALAGASSPFALKLHKPDRQSALNGLRLELPQGLLASVKDNVGKQVGTATVAAGPGSQPFWLNGPVVLEGPYGDAPYSMRVTVPAKAGPFDLGDVVVRQKIYVDPADAHVTVVSDPLPTVVKGVPVRMQNLNVVVDKPGFIRNPTDCAKKTIRATLGAETGQTAAVSSHFQVSGCAGLKFEPRLGLSLTGKRQMRTGKHPGVRALVRQSGLDEAGIEKAVVTLPKSLALDPDNAQALCEFVDGTKPDLEKHCPAGSTVGRARAKTPLLERDLTGNVYFVKNVRRDAKTGNEIRTLPMIVVALRGEIAINLKGESSTTKAGRLVNTFASVPDAPITQFNLNIAGGKSGILAVTRTRKAKINICAKPKSHVAAAEFDGQNGKVHDRDVRFKAPCAKKAKGSKAAERKAQPKRRGAAHG
jgi:hypothetical protein